MSHRKVFSALVPFSLVFLLLVETAWTIPKLISFQGVLVDKQGSPVDGTFEVTFRMYHQEKEGTAAWEEKQTVTVSDGVYHTLLGNAKPVNVDFSKDVWLGVEVGTNKEMAPRFRLASVAYAFRAETAETLQGKSPTDFATSGHAHPAPTVTAAEIVDGTITNADVSASAGIGYSKLSHPDTDHSTLAKSSDLSAAGTINGAANPIDWTKLKSVPAGFADGVDDGGTTYSAGAGLSLTGSTFSVNGVSSAMITDGEIVNADISTTAAIADTKLATISTSGKVADTALSATVTKLGGTIESTEITDGEISNVDISATAAIATTKLSGAVTSITGHGLGALATLASVGSPQVTDGSIVDVDVSASAAIAMSKLEGDPKTAGTINTGTNPIDWTKLKGVPAGFADGVDADTTNALSCNADATCETGAISATGNVTFTGNLSKTAVGTTTIDLVDAANTVLNVTNSGAGTASIQVDGVAVNSAPASMVAFFNLASCPAGWTEYTAARGLYIVGLPLSGTLAGTAGTALSNLEDRAVGQHNHTITDPGHSHTYTVNSTSGGAALPIGNSTTLFTTPSTSTNTTGVTINNAGTVAGTNAPYIQLLACQKS